MERVQALYKINEHRKAYYKQIQDCKSRYNAEVNKYEKALDSITSIAVSMGEKSEEFVSHNLDLQEGLLGSLKKMERQEIELAKLKAKRVKSFGIGAYGGYDLLHSVPSVGVSLNYNLFYLF
jgi:t-SNARE complex subunit (syntaxin)